MQKWSSCPNTSSNWAENIPTPVLLNSAYFMLLRGFKETELLFKSAFTKKPFKSVKINYFEVYFSNMPPAFPAFPIFRPTEPTETIFNHLYKLWGDSGHSRSQPELQALTKSQGLEPWEFFHFFPSSVFQSVLKLPYILEAKENAYMTILVCYIEWSLNFILVITICPRQTLRCHSTLTIYILRGIS